MDEALDITTQIAEGLLEAHRHDIVPRDIERANVMTTPRGRAKMFQAANTVIDARHLKTFW